MQEKHKRRARNGGLVAAVFLAIYIPSFLHWVYGRDISTDIIRMGALEECVNCEGYIIRNSVVYASQFDGKYIPEFDNGEKAPAKSSIAVVIKKPALKLLDSLNEKKLNIIEALNKKNENAELFSTDIAKIDNEVSNKLKIIISDANMNVLSGLKSLKKDIDDLMDKKASIMGGVKTADAYINSLEKERERLKEQIKSNTWEVVSESPGIVSYIVDDYEEVLKPGALRELTPEILKSVNIKQTAYDNNNEVIAGKPFLKIIKGFEYYIAFLLPQKDAELFSIGDRINVRINDIGKTVSCKVCSKSENFGGKYIVAVEVDRFMSETSGLRKVNADLIINSPEGLKVPLKSLFEMDASGMKAKIMLVKANCAAIREVKIVGMNEEYAVITGLEGSNKGSVGLYDIYVCDPRNIKEGEIIYR